MRDHVYEVPGTESVAADVIITISSSPLGSLTPPLTIFSMAGAHWDFKKQSQLFVVLGQSPCPFQHKWI